MRNSRLLRHCLSLWLASIAVHGSSAQVPGEVGNLGWCPGSKECIEWSVEPLADTYQLYRGTSCTLDELLSGAPDSCLVGEFVTPDSGPSIGLVPVSGCFHWFLVTARNGSGEGTPGTATTGGRLLDSAGLCASPAAGVVINEIDYDQPNGSDFDEFVELYNPSSDPFDLTGVSLVLVNGANQTEYGRVDLSTCASSLLFPGDYVVVASPTVSTPPGTEVILFPSSSNNLQNGGPDAVALFDTETDTVLDALSYEGSVTAALISGAPGTYNLVEGSPTTASDTSSSGSLNRIPNGVDTDDNASDWSFFATPSPGANNGGMGTIVINEVDYDQPGSPDADEFVELFNPSATPVSLGGLVLVLVNGSTQTEYDRIDLNTGPSSLLLPGDYLVIASPTVVTPPGTDVILFPSPSNSVQNGGPDALAVFDTASNTVLDALSYEGSVTAAAIVGAPGTYNLVEGSPTAAIDSSISASALARLPNGLDTDDAANDWSISSSPSAGSPNLP